MILVKDVSFPKRCIFALFCEQVITIQSILTVLFKTISATVLAIIAVFGGEGIPDSSDSSPLKDKETRRKWLHKQVEILKRLCGKAVEGC